MLQNIRQYATGWISWTLVALISMAFALWGVQNYITGSQKAKVVAKVNRHKITEAQLKNEYRRVRQQLTSQFGSGTTINENLQQVLRDQALQQLITREVLIQSATASGYRVSGDQLSSVIHNMPAFQFDGKFSYPRFRQILENMGYTEESFLREMDQNLLMGQLRAGIERTTFSLENEIKQAVFLAEQQRDFDYIVIEADQFKDKVKVTDDEINAYYEQHKKEYETPERVRLAYVVLSADDIKKNIEITDADVKAFYEDNPGLASTPREWKVQQIIVPLALDANETQINEAKTVVDEIITGIDNGKDINEISKIVKQKNKDIEFTTDDIKAGRRDSHIIKNIATLKVGEHSDPFRSEKGLHVTKVIKIQEPKPIPFAEVKAKLRDALLKQKVEQAFILQSEELTELAYTNPDSLEPVVEALKLPIKTTEFFSRDGVGEGIESNPNVLQVAFSEDILLQGNNSTPIEVGNGRVVVLRVKDHEPSKLLPVEQVKDKIVAVLTHNATVKKAAELGDIIVKALRSGKDKQSVADQYKLSWKSETKITRTKPGVDREVAQLAFKLPDPAAVNTKPVAGDRLAGGNYTVVQLNNIHQNKDHKMSDQQRKVFEDALATGYGRMEFDLLVKSLMDRAKIKIIEK